MFVSFALNRVNMVNKYKIAGLIVSMNSFGRTKRQAEVYLQEEAGDSAIVIDSHKDAFRKRMPRLSDDDAEYLATGANFYRQLLNYGGLMLHSSAVVVDGKAYLFSANPGTGKSTHTGLWLQLFGERAFILNDDKPALRLMDDGTWYAFGTPWSGKHDISVNTGVPIAGICMLERGEVNKIAPFGGKEAIFEIFAQTNRPKAAEYRMKLMELLDDLIRNVPVWKLKCNMDPEAAVVSYEAMSGQKLER